MQKHNRIIKCISLLVCSCLLFEQTGFAQLAGEINLSSHLAGFSAPLKQDKFHPPHLRYLSYDNSADTFKVFLQKGDITPENELAARAKDLLKYFFTGISLPDDTFWVNLRPDSPDNIISPLLEGTDIGKIFMESDVKLKKDTAQFVSPATAEGKEYWDSLYKKAAELYGSENVSIPTLTRPWIVPDEIIIRETEKDAYIYKATLKVMLEQDYLKDNSIYNFKDERARELNEYASQLIREKIIPKLDREVNTGRSYAKLRQVYYSLIMAQWFKQKFYGKSGRYSSRIDTKDLNGITCSQPWDKTVYFEDYKRSFQDGEYNIKESLYSSSGQAIRSYVSGGIQFGVSVSSAIEAGKVIGNASTDLATIMAGSSSIVGVDIEGEIEDVSVTVSKRMLPVDLPEQGASSSLSEQPPDTAYLYGVVERRSAFQNIMDNVKSAIEWFFSPETFYAKRLDRLINRAKIATKQDFKVIVEDDSPSNPSVAWVTPGDKNIPVLHFERTFMKILSEAELAFVVLHELSHPFNKDFELMEELQVYVDSGRFAKAYNLLDAHSQIEADKKAVEFMRNMGYAAKSAVSALDKAAAFMGDDAEFKLRRIVLKQLIDKPDGLSDFYITFSDCLSALALGFRYETDLRNPRQRARELLVLADSLRHVLDNLKGGLENITSQLEKSADWHKDPNHQFADTINRTLLISIAINCATIDFLLSHLGDGSDEARNYRDRLRNAKDELEAALSRMLQDSVTTATLRLRKDTIREQYYPDKLLESTDLEFPHELFAKLITKFLYLADFSFPIGSVLPGFTRGQGQSDKASVSSKAKPKDDRYYLKFSVFLLPLMFFTFQHNWSTIWHKTTVPIEQTISEMRYPMKITNYAPFEHSGRAADGTRFNLDGSNCAVFVDRKGAIKLQDGGLVAVDPNTIKLGSKVLVVLPDGQQVNYKAADTGGKVNGNKIDVSVNRSSLSVTKAIDNKFNGARIFVDGQAYEVGLTGPVETKKTYQAYSQEWQAEENNNSLVNYWLLGIGMLLSNMWSPFPVRIKIPFIRRRSDPGNNKNSQGSQPFNPVRGLDAWLRNSASSALAGDASRVENDPLRSQQSPAMPITQKEATDMVLPASSMLNNEESGASAKPGGIDMRSIKRDYKIERINAASTLFEQGESGYGMQIELGKDWQEIEDLLRSGVDISCERIRDYLLSMDNLSIEIMMACLSKLLLIQEENIIKTNPGLKEMLAVMESGKNGREIQLALSGISFQ